MEVCSRVRGLSPEHPKTRDCVTPVLSDSTEKIRCPATSQAFGGLRPRPRRELPSDNRSHKPGFGSRGP